MTQGPRLVAGLVRFAVVALSVGVKLLEPGHVHCVLDKDGLWPVGWGLWSRIQLIVDMDLPEHARGALGELWTFA